MWFCINHFISNGTPGMLMTIFSDSDAEMQSEVSAQVETQYIASLQDSAEVSLFFGIGCSKVA
jgi:hypothetical protein